MGEPRPGSIRVLLSNPRWEKRPILFLELSGVGRIVESAVDEEAAQAERLDGWVIWECEERAAG